MLTDVIELRRRVGMVFQKPTPFPKSIYENVAYGLRIAGVRRKSILDDAVEKSLRRAALWDEVKDRLRESALGSRRTAPATLHCPRNRRQSRDHPHGRALLGLGPPLHRGSKISSPSCAANTPSSSSPTTCSRPPGSPIGPPSCTREPSSNSARLKKYSPNPIARKPRIISPAASANYRSIWKIKQFV